MPLQDNFLTSQYILTDCIRYISDSKELSKWFLDHGADPNAPCAWDFTSMSEAMYHASLDTIQMLFSRGGDITRGQLLHNAVWRDGPDTVVLVDLLLRKGALINEIQYQQHPQAFAEQSMLGLGTPLHYAVETNREDLVTFLISHGADPSIRNTKGRTAFDIADIRKNVNISQILRKDRV
jgi:ankyrin repeat protein